MSYGFLINFKIKTRTANLFLAKSTEQRTRHATFISWGCCSKFIIYLSTRVPGIYRPVPAGIYHIIYIYNTPHTHLLPAAVVVLACLGLCWTAACRGLPGALGQQRLNGSMDGLRDRVGHAFLCRECVSSVSGTLGHRVQKKVVSHFPAQKTTLEFPCDPPALRSHNTLSHQRHHHAPCGPRFVLILLMPRTQLMKYRGSGRGSWLVARQFSHFSWC